MRQSLEGDPSRNSGSRWSAIRQEFRNTLWPVVTVGAAIIAVVTPIGRAVLTAEAAVNSDLATAASAAASNALPALETAGGAFRYAEGARAGGPCNDDPSTLRELQLLGGANPTGAEVDAAINCAIYGDKLPQQPPGPNDPLYSIMLGDIDAPGADHIIVG
jgi:hypothetical protein